MASSSSRNWRYDVFPSFSGEDVRKGFLSYLLKEFDRRSINSFIDNGIERSRPIGPELISAIKEARISVVIFSKKYPASTWCLNELVEIYKSYKELGQMVIPVFYYVNPSDVRKRTGEFGKFFEETCKGKHKDHIQRWMQALTDVANIAGEDLHNGPNEAHMVEKIANNVSNNLLTPSNGFDDFIGLEAHIEAMKSILCLESKEAKMIGIWGQSGIGKSTLGRALFSHLSPKFPFRNFTTYKYVDQDVYGMKLNWEQRFLSDILNQKDLKIENIGEVKKRLKDKKVLIVLDDVLKLVFLETLVGKTEWFGPGSRIIVITQDTHILKGHKIQLLHEVKLPAPDIALKILCRSAFAQDSPPDDFKELAVEVAKIAGNLPLGLSVLGSSLKERTTEEWKELLPGLRKSLKGDIMKTLKVGYDRLDEKEKEIFLWIASLFNGKNLKSINDFFGDNKGGLKRLVEKSLIRIASKEKNYGNEEIVVEMHNLLVILGREIVRAESIGNPLGKLRFPMDAEEVREVLANETGRETVLGIYLDHASMNEKSLEGMFNLQFIEIINSDLNRTCIPNGLLYLRNLKWLVWDYCPLKCLPSNFRAEILVELRMRDSELEKLWDGTLQLGSLKTIIMSCSYYLKEIPDLSNAINLEGMDFSWCSKLEGFPDLSKAINLRRVDFSYCYNLETFPKSLNWESLEYLNLEGCNRLKIFPQIKMERLPHGIEIHVYGCLWNSNLHGPDYLDCLRRCYPIKFLPEHLVSLSAVRSRMEKLWEGVQLLGSLQKMELISSIHLKEIPNLSKATNLQCLYLYNCKSLAGLPSTIGNLQKLEKLEIKECRGIKVLPVDVNLSSLKILNLSGCSSLNSFPQISRSIEYLNLDHTAIEEVPCLIEMFHRLTKLSMHGCNKLKNISPKIFRLTDLKQVDFTDCGDCVITTLTDSTVVASIEDPHETVEKRNKVDKDKDEGPWNFNFQNCLKLDRDARELIIQSSLKWTMILPGGEVPSYFKHRAYGDSLTVTLPQSSLSHKFLRFNVCVVVEPRTNVFNKLYLQFSYDGVYYKHDVYVYMLSVRENHLVLFSFKFQPTDLPSKLDINDVQFEFEAFTGIKEFGIRLLNMSPSPDDKDGRSSVTQYNQQSGEKCDVVETERRKKQMQMISSEEYFNLPYDQVVTDTGMITPNLEFPLGRRKSSSVSRYPCTEGEALCIDSMITEHQDLLIPIVDPKSYDTLWPSWSTNWARASIFSCWEGLLLVILCTLLHFVRLTKSARASSASIFSSWGGLLLFILCTLYYFLPSLAGQNSESD